MAFTVRRMIVLITEFLLLLSSFTSVSGLCSTCTGNRCYDNGECIIGCVPGYLGEYCNEECPSKCLNNICHIDRIDGTVTCTEGCEEGYCDVQCEVECPRGCVSCDRHCGSCNVTLCPERHYGADCSKVCSPKHGKCDRETGQCIICRRGYYGDECTRVCRGCFTRAENIVDSCLSGCEMCQAEEACPVGFYGNSCEHKCSPACVNPERGCNTATGECSTGCVSGYHGLNCNYKCSEHCLSGRCNNATGECSTGCVSGHYGLTCNYTCNMFCVGGICDQYNGICTSGCVSGYKSNSDRCEKNDDEGTETYLVIAVSITLAFLLTASVATIVIWRGHKFIRFSRARTEEIDSELELQEQLIPGHFDETSKLKILDLRKRTEKEIDCFTSGMIEVSAVDTVVDKLKSGLNWVTITGNAGDGKTTLAYLVLKRFQGEMNVYNIELPEEYYLVRNLNKWLILLDDRFGAFTSDQLLINKWKTVINDIHKHIAVHGHNKTVIFVSRKNVVNETRDYLGYFQDTILHRENVVDLSSVKVKDERLRFLDLYMNQGGLKVKSEIKHRIADLDIAHGFPHCCMMYPKLRLIISDLDIVEFFKSPLRFLDITTSVLYRDNCKDLFELMIKNDGTFNAHEVEDDTQRKSLLKVESEQEGSYITVWRNGVCKFAHPSIYESVLSVICDTDPLFCVKYAKLSVIRQKLTFRLDEIQKSPTQINVKPVQPVLKALATRFRQEILQGDYTVFNHRFCDSMDFCKELMASCVYSDAAASLQEENPRQHIDAPDKDSMTMFWTALIGGKKPAVSALVEHGADVNIPDRSGNTPLLFLCKQDEVDFETIRELVTGKADCNLTDERGITPFSYLLFRRDVDIETMLLMVTKGGFEINQNDNMGATPLHWMSRNSSFSVVDIKQMAANGQGDINKVDSFGFTPLHYLCSRDVDIKSLVSLVQEFGGAVNKTDLYSNTPLHYLCLTNKRNVAYLLKNIQGADMTLQNGEGCSSQEFLDGNAKSSQLILTPTLDRSLNDLIMRPGYIKWTPVTGSAMSLRSDTVHELLQVEDNGQELTNIGRRVGPRSGNFSKFLGTHSDAVFASSFPSSLSFQTLHQPASYWETDSRVKWNKGGGFILLEMGLVEGRRNLDTDTCISHHCASVCVSVMDKCNSHYDGLCIRVWRKDQEGHRSQVGDCVTRARPAPSELLTFKFGLVVDWMRGKVAFIDLGSESLVCKIGLRFTNEVYPMFFVSSLNQYCETRMRLVSGIQISVSGRKKKLIHEALLD